MAIISEIDKNNNFSKLRPHTAVVVWCGGIGHQQIIDLKWGKNSAKKNSSVKMHIWVQ
jgi:hypothetical protein